MRKLTVKANIPIEQNRPAIKLLNGSRQTNTPYESCNTKVIPASITKLSIILSLVGVLLSYFSFVIIIADFKVGIKLRKSSAFTPVNFSIFYILIQ